MGHLKFNVTLNFNILAFKLENNYLRENDLKFI